MDEALRAGLLPKVTSLEEAELVCDPGLLTPELLSLTITYYGLQEGFADSVWWPCAPGWRKGRREQRRGSGSRVSHSGGPVTQAPRGAYSHRSQEAPAFPLVPGDCFQLVWARLASDSGRQAQASYSLLSPHSRLRGGGSQDSKRPQNKWTSYLISQPGLLSDHCIMAWRRWPQAALQYGRNWGSWKSGEGAGKV